MPKDKLGVFEQIVQVFKEESNMARLREVCVYKCCGLPALVVHMRATQPLQALAAAQGPAIPYLGMYLSDLTYLDAALDSYVRPHVINVDKRRKEATLLLVRMTETGCMLSSLVAHDSPLLSVTGSGTVPAATTTLL